MQWTMTASNTENGGSENDHSTKPKAWDHYLNTGLVADPSSPRSRSVQHMFSPRTLVTYAKEEIERSRHRKDEAGRQLDAHQVVHGHVGAWFERRCLRRIQQENGKEGGRMSPVGESSR